MKISVSNLLIEKENIKIDIDATLRNISSANGLSQDELKQRVKQISDRIAELMRPKVCFIESSVRILDERLVDLEVLSLESPSLARYLSGCRKAYLFAATLGEAVDEEIEKQGSLSELDGLLCDTLGSAALEGLCEEVERQVFEMENKMLLKVPFRLGQGKLPFEEQEKLLQLLDAEKKMGLRLTEEGRMAPSKSLIAIVGVSSQKTEHTPGSQCALCPQVDCEYRDKEF